MDTKFIPRHLIPVSERAITDEWAIENYAYRCHFNSTVSLSIPDENEIKAWKKEARTIADVLKRDGIMHAENEIILLCNTRYAHKFQDTAVNNIYDVVKFFDDNALVKEDYETYLDMLHMFQYGIFRCAYNAWAVDAASLWLKDRNLAYDPGPASIKRKGKGFVYKLLVNRASNTLCVRFQKLSLRLHNEYVIVRDKKLEEKQDLYNIIPHVFNNTYRGYIMRSKKHNNDLDDDISLEDQSSLMNLVRKAIEHGETIASIKAILNNCIKHGNKGKKCVIYNINKPNMIILPDT